jgi:hypothetical protein
VYCILERVQRTGQATGLTALQAGEVGPDLRCFMTTPKPMNRRGLCGYELVLSQNLRKERGASTRIEFAILTNGATRLGPDLHHLRTTPKAMNTRVLRRYEPVLSQQPSEGATPTLPRSRLGPDLHCFRTRATRLGPDLHCFRTTPKPMNPRDLRRCEPVFRSSRAKVRPQLFRSGGGPEVGATRLGARPSLPQDNAET